jgi:hypothetical protein
LGFASSVKNVKAFSMALSYENDIMRKMVLVIDESGAKGYATVREQNPGEIGVMAGFLYPEEEIIWMKSLFDSAIDLHRSNGKAKFHITDLDAESQTKLRNVIFNIFRDYKFQWFYVAIYAEGYHQSEFSPGRGFQDRKALLHAELFEKIFSHSICMSSSIQIKKLDLKVITDNIDSGVIKIFKSKAERISNIFTRRKRQVFTYIRDAEARSVRKEIAEFSVQSESIPKFDDIKFDVTCEISSLTIVADILANSVNYYLKKNQKETIKKYISNKQAIEDHPLVDLAIIPKDSDHVLPILDVIYRRSEDIKVDCA